MNSDHYLTEEKQLELEQELDFLKTTKRKEIADSLEFAKSLGDLSENAEYHEALDNQGKTEDRILKLEDILKNIVVVKEHHSQVVEIGSNVVVSRKGSDENQKYFIVGSEEADISEKKISNESPLGAGLLGKKKDDVVSIVTPNGKVDYTIIEIA
ncbi:MAG: transcription elongation factor GreA [Patescibacteria group bacterium]